MFIINNINPKWFFLSLSLGLLIVYCSTPNPEIIIKYPTPENSNRTVFSDDSDNCYKFITDEIKCPKSDLINEIPIQKKANII
jgi:hypothetical protein